MSRVTTFFFLCMFIGASVWASDVGKFYATSIDVSQGVATLYSKEPVLLGVSCKTGPVGRLAGLRTISIGDTIKNNRYSFRVGIIEVSMINEDASWGGETIAKKGDIVCHVAPSEDALSSDKGCDALWLQIVHCRPLK